jgi:hypothetical protein
MDKMMMQDMPKMPKESMQTPKNKGKCKDALKSMPKGVKGKK